MTSKTSVKKIYKQLLKKGVINSKVTLGDVWDKQIGGSHYQKFKIQPSKFVIDNKLLYPEGCVIKYIIRHSRKNGKEDLLKAKHFIDMIIERDYS
jgi:hypothetical protein